MTLSLSEWGWRCMLLLPSRPHLQMSWGEAAWAPPCQLLQHHEGPAEGMPLSFNWELNNKYFLRRNAHLVKRRTTLWLRMWFGDLGRGCCNCASAGIMACTCEMLTFPSLRGRILSCKQAVWSVYKCVRVIIQPGVICTWFNDGKHRTNVKT